jgi:hypothetical protein
MEERQGLEELSFVMDLSSGEEEIVVVLKEERARK